MVLSNSESLSRFTESMPWRWVKVGEGGRGLGLCVYYPTLHLDFNKANVYMPLKVTPGRPCYRERRLLGILQKCCSAPSWHAD